MAGVENHFTVFIRLPFSRGDFVDPPPVAWSATKERALWDILSRQAKGNEIDWRALSEKFEVTQPFLLQQAAWLYERQLSQVRAQMRRVGARQSATPSPAPGSTAASMVGGQAMKRAGSGGSRVPSRLSTQALGSPVTGGDSTPGTPAKSRGSLPFRNPSVAGAGGVGTSSSQARTVSGTGTGTGTGTGISRPISRQSSKDAEGVANYAVAQSRRGSIHHHPARSPGQTRTAAAAAAPESSESEDELTQSRITARRPNPSSIHRRTLSLRKDLRSHRGSSSNPSDTSTPQPQGSDGDDNNNDDGDEDEDDDGPAFLPFATPPVSETRASVAGRSSSSSQPPPQDSGATLRGPAPVTSKLQQPPQPPQSSRPATIRRTTSERIGSPEPPPSTSSPIQTDRPRGPASTTAQTTSTAPSTQGTARQNKPSSTPMPTTAAAQPQPTVAPTPPTMRPAISNPNPNPNPLSPPHRALLQSSPRRHPGPGSDTSPSMGSSFSDLDDASVTQSALEEALLSGMGNTTMTMPGAGVAGRVSGISQALRSRYFDSSNRGGGGGGDATAGQQQRQRGGRAGNQ
ncbi:Autophagy-related protein 29 [Exophiala dermatitidis]